MFGYFPRLKERFRQQAGTLSGGEQQMLAITRALLLRPRLLLLDEPSFGLAPLIVKEIFNIMRRIREEEKVSILLVEQNASLALAFAEDAYLLETGRIVVSGKAADISKDEVDPPLVSWLLKEPRRGRTDPPDHLRHRHRRDLRQRVARVGDDLPGHASHQFRPGRDGDIFDVYHVDVHQFRHAVLGRVLPGRRGVVLHRRD